MGAYFCQIFGGASSLEAAVDGKGRLTALGAIGVASIPVEKLARFRVDGGFRSC